MTALRRPTIVFSSAVLALAVAFLLVVTLRYPVRYASLVRREAERNGLQPELVAAVMVTESGCDPSAVSERGASGLMQLMPSTAEWCAARLGLGYSPEMLADPEYNLRLGAYYLARLVARFGDLDAALAAYNAGEGNVARWLADGKLDIPFPETAAYVRRVRAARRAYLFRNYP